MKLPSHTDIKRRLANVMDEWIERINDCGRLAEDEAIVEKAARRTKQNYDKLLDRPDDWFFSHRSLGSYDVSQRKDDPSPTPR